MEAAAMPAPAAPSHFVGDFTPVRALSFVDRQQLAGDGAALARCLSRAGFPTSDVVLFGKLRRRQG